jgi:hypothetical protein
VPIIIVVTAAAGAGATLRPFGPESMGGMGPIIDAEVAHTGLSKDEVGPKVHISISNS